MIDIEVVDKLFEAGRASGSPMQFRLFDKRVLLPLGQLPEAVAREAGDTVSEGDLHALAAEGGSLCCPVPALKSGLYVLALKRGRTSREVPLNSK